MEPIVPEQHIFHVNFFSAMYVFLTSFPLVTIAVNDIIWGINYQPTFLPLYRLWTSYIRTIPFFLLEETATGIMVDSQVVGVITR